MEVTMSVPRYTDADIDDLAASDKYDVWQDWLKTFAAAGFCALVIVGLAMGVLYHMRPR
jgi:hypothetical protein